ncbi:MAG: hypothetical protein ACK527_15755, partial [Acidobacteriota bacterium]
KRAAANRENARKSTGPRTPEGKAASCQNRLAHGLCSSSLILHGENPEEFDELRRQTHTTFAPVTAEETLLTDQLVEATWRLNRARRVEAKSLEQLLVVTQLELSRFSPRQEVPSGDASLATAFAKPEHQKRLSCLQRYLNANERSYRCALKTLQDAIKRRQPQPETQPVPAVTAKPATTVKPKVAAAGQALYREEDTELPASPAPAVPSFNDRC